MKPAGPDIEISLWFYEDEYNAREIEVYFSTDDGKFITNCLPFQKKRKTWTANWQNITDES